MKKRLILSIIVALTAAFCVHAQSANVVSELLETEKATLGQVSYLCATELNLISESSSYAEAVDALKKEGILKNSAKLTAESPVRLGQLTLILSKTWKINESLFYNWFQNRRYAFMQCKALNIIPSSATSLKIVSGQEVLNYVTICIGRFEGNLGGAE